MSVTKNDRRNAYLYCKFRDDQYACYDKYAKQHGMSMNMLLIVNALYYAKEGLTQREICDITHESKQTVNLNIKALLAENSVTVAEIPTNKRMKVVMLTETGRQKYKKPITHITRSEDTAMSLLTSEEQEILIELSRRFTKDLIRLIEGEDVNK